MIGDVFFILFIIDILIIGFWYVIYGTLTLAEEKTKKGIILFEIGTVACVSFIPLLILTVIFGILNI